VGGAPAVALPVVHPAGDALPNILRIRMQIDGAGAGQRLQRRNSGHQLHAIIGRQLLAAAKFLFHAVIDEDGAPAAGPGIAGTGAIGPDFYAARHASRPYSPARSMVWWKRSLSRYSSGFFGL